MTKSAFELAREKLKNKNQNSTEFVGDINNQKIKEENKERVIEVEDNSIFSNLPDNLFKIPNFEYKDLNKEAFSQKTVEERSKYVQTLVELGANNNKSILVLLSLLYSTDLYVKNIIDFLHKSQEEMQISLNEKTLEEVSKTIETKLNVVVSKNVDKAENNLTTKLQVVEELVNNFIKVEDSFKNKINELKSLNLQVENNNSKFQTSINNGTEIMNTLFLSLENKVEEILNSIAEEILESQISSLDENFQKKLDESVQKLNGILKQERDEGNTLLTIANDKIHQALTQIVNTLESEKFNISKEIIAGVNNGINNNFNSLVSQTLPQIDQKLTDWVDKTLVVKMKAPLDSITKENNQLKTNITNLNTTVSEYKKEMDNVKDKMSKIFYGALFLGATNLVLILMFLLKK